MPRKSKNQALSVADGYWRENPERAREIVPVDEFEVTMPGIVQADDLASEIWHETVAALKTMGLIANQDSALIATYCVNYAFLLRCMHSIRQNGDTSITRDGGQKASGDATNYHRYMGLHTKLLGELGLTPSSRASLAPPKEKGKEDGTKVAEILKRLSG